MLPMTTSMASHVATFRERLKALPNFEHCANNSFRQESSRPQLIGFRAQALKVE